MGLGVNISQALLGTALSVLFLFMPTVNAAYWVLSALTVQVLCLMYMLVFASVVALRYSQPETARAYRIPGGMAGVWIVGGAGFVACLFTFMVGFFPPSNVESGSTLVYVVGMIVGTITSRVRHSCSSPPREGCGHERPIGRRPAGLDPAPSSRPSRERARADAPAPSGPPIESRTALSARPLFGNRSRRAGLPIRPESRVRDWLETLAVPSGLVIAVSVPYGIR